MNLLDREIRPTDPVPDPKEKRSARKGLIILAAIYLVVALVNASLLYAAASQPLELIV